MAKESGLGQEFYFDGVDLSGDTGSAQSIKGGLTTVLPVAGINRLAHERIGGGRDGSLTWQSWFNPALGQSHKTLSTLPYTDRVGSWVHRPVLGGSAACIVGKQSNYDGTREANGNFPFAIQVLGNQFGLEWTDQLTAGLDVFSGTGAGTGLDYGAAIGTTAFGLQAYLQVNAFTGANATVTIQHSQDNGAGDAYTNVTGGAFAQITTAPGSQRIQTSRTESIERWLRINITGTFSSLTIAVFVLKNLVATVVP